MAEALGYEANLTFNICSEVIGPSEEYNIYQISKYKLRGIVYILNISYEGREEERKGSVYDVENIRRLFEMLKYEVVEIKESKFKKIIEERNISRSEKLRDAAIFIMFLKSHDKDQHLIDEDGEEMNITEIFLKQFHSDKCLHLANKPKRFFLQACRHIKVIKNKKSKKVNVVSLEVIEKLSHPCAHFFRFNSTFENYKSARFSNTGSIFIRVLLLAIANFCHATDLDTIAQLVNHIMNSLPNAKNFHHELQQISFVDSKSLTKAVYFLPTGEDEGGRNIKKIVFSLKN